MGKRQAIDKYIDYTFKSIYVLGKHQ